MGIEVERGSRAFLPCPPPGLDGPEVEVDCVDDLCTTTTSTSCVGECTIEAPECEGDCETTITTICDGPCTPLTEIECAGPCTTITEITCDGECGGPAPPEVDPPADDPPGGDPPPADPPVVDPPAGDPPVTCDGPCTVVVTTSTACAGTCSEQVIVSCVGACTLSLVQSVSQGRLAPTPAATGDGAPMTGRASSTAMLGLALLAVALGGAALARRTVRIR